MAVQRTAGRTLAARTRDAQLAVHIDNRNEQTGAIEDGVGIAAERSTAIAHTDERLAGHRKTNPVEPLSEIADQRAAAVFE